MYLNTSGYRTLQDNGFTLYINLERTHPHRDGGNNPRQPWTYRKKKTEDNAHEVSSYFYLLQNMLMIEYSHLIFYEVEYHMYFLILKKIVNSFTIWPPYQTACALKHAQHASSSDHPLSQCMLKFSWYMIGVPQNRKMTITKSVTSHDPFHATAI